MTPPDIVLVLCDTARADAFSPWNIAVDTPAVAELATRGIVYTQSYAPAPWTLPSTASIFSGLLPTEHGITGDAISWDGDRPSSPAEAVRGYSGPWLTDSLAQRGYRTWGGSCNVWVSGWGGFDRGFDHMLSFDVRRGHRNPIKGKSEMLRNQVRHAWGKLDSGGKRTIEAVSQQLASPGRDPLFTAINLMETHRPYDPPRPFFPYAPWKRRETVRLSNTKGMPGRFILYTLGLVDPPPGYIDAVRRLYFAAARYEDWLIGRLVSAIRARSRPTVVVMVGDHGEHLGEHGMFTHNSSLHEPLLHVPLLVAGFGVDIGPGLVDQPVSMLGLRAWLEAIADQDEEPMSPNGAIVSEYESTVRSTGLRSRVRATIEKHDRLSLPPLAFNAGVAIRIGDRKLIASEDGRRWLFDLASDPNEEHDVLGWQPEAAAPFEDHERAWRSRRLTQPQYEPGAQSEDEVAEHLRMLGYIE